MITISTLTENILMKFIRNGRRFGSNELKKLRNLIRIEKRLRR